jgi:hypothetical protein
MEMIRKGKWRMAVVDIGGKEFLGFNLCFYTFGFLESYCPVDR